MLFAAFRRTLAVVSALLPIVSLAAQDHKRAAAGQSTFISPGGEIGFGFTVPPRSDGSDVYFTLRVPVGIAWGAVGLGSDTMERALVLMVYLNWDGTNVTFSPRYGQGLWEPAWLDEVEVQVLDGTGIVNQGGIDYMLFRARCYEGCRRWHNGYLDVYSDDVPAIYAFGPRDARFDNDPASSVLYHSEHGKFSIDMGRTEGPSDPPVVDASSASDGTRLIESSRKTGLVDGKSIAHGIVMILSMQVLFPLGVFMLHRKGFAAHAVVQLLGLAGSLAGFGLGITASFHYQRSRSFSDKHQVLGFIIMAGVLAQPVLGILHHRRYMRTQQKGRLALAHRWIGRIVLILAVFNALLGFLFAGNFTGGRIFSLLVIVTGLVSIVVRVFLEVRRRKWQNHNGVNPAHPGGHQPWRQDPPPNSFGAGNSNSYAGNSNSYAGNSNSYAGNSNSYTSSSQPSGIGLVPVSSPTRDAEAKEFGISSSSSPRADANRTRTDLGPVQTPREFA